MGHTGWHVLYVRPRFQSLVASRLRPQRLEIYLPVYRTKHSHKAVELPLFPRYLFCKIDDVSRVLMIPGILDRVHAAQCDVEEDVKCLKRVSKSGLKYGPGAARQRETFALVEGGQLDGFSGFVSAGNCLTIPIKSICRSIIIQTELTCKLVRTNLNTAA